MRQRHAPTWFVLVTLALCCPKALADEATDRELEQLSGTFQVLKHERMGRTTPAAELRSMRVTRKGATWTLTTNKDTFQFRDSLKPGSSPKEIDTTTIPAGDKKPQQHLGIYDIGKGEIKFCWAEPGGKRPTLFTAPEGSRRWLLVLKALEVPKITVAGMRPEIPVAGDEIQLRFRVENPDGSGYTIAVTSDTPKLNTTVTRDEITLPRLPAGDYAFNIQVTNDNKLSSAVLVHRIRVVAKAPPVTKVTPPVTKVTPPITKVVTPPVKGVLFNGKNLEGWTGATQIWMVKNGDLRTTEGLNPDASLDSVAKYSDFELSLELKVTGEVLFGLRFRGKKDGTMHQDAAGPMFQFAGPTWRPTTGTRPHWLTPRTPTKMTSAPWKMSTKEIEKAVLRDDFNLIRLTAKDKRWTASINGRVALDGEVTGMPLDGVIGLVVQANNLNRGRVEIRNLKIKTLP